MEEMQSTEILSREILEDARKKAQRNLKTADETIRKKTTEWENNTKTSLDEMRKKYEKQREACYNEIMAFLPIDKRRTKAKIIEGFLDDAIKDWYSGLSRKQMLSILQKQLNNCIEINNLSGDIHVFIHKISKAEAKSLLDKALPKKSYNIEEENSTAEYPQIIIDSHKVRIIASINKTIDFFLDRKRKELAEALFGSKIKLDGLDDESEGAA